MFLPWTGILNVFGWKETYKEICINYVEMMTERHSQKASHEEWPLQVRHLRITFSATIV